MARTKDSLGARVRKVRKSKRLTQAAVAEAAHLHVTNLCKLEKDHPSLQNPSLDLVKRLAGALGVSLADLIPGGR